MKEEGIDGDERLFIVGEIAEDPTERRNIDIGSLRSRE
jgi:hypothetical protein